MRRKKAYSSLLLICLSVSLAPLLASAQTAAGCHPITAEEREALTLREAEIPTSGIFCDADRVVMFGGCEKDPLPILLAQYKPGTLSKQEGQRGITRLQPEFACRLSRFLTTFPGCIVSAWRSNETQQKLWEDALKKYGSEAEARKYVAPPGKSRHNTGIAADLCIPSSQAQAAAPSYGLVFRLEYEPWHIEGVGITDTQGQITNPQPPRQLSDTFYSYSPPLPYSIPQSSLSQLISVANTGLQFYALLGQTISPLTSPLYYHSYTLGDTLYIVPHSSSTLSLADVLTAALGSSTPPLYISLGTTTVAVTDILPLLQPTTTPEESGNVASSTEEFIRTLMLRVIELLRELLRLLIAQTSA